MLPALQAQLAAIAARVRLRAQRTTAALCGLLIVLVGVAGLALTLTTDLHPGWLLLALALLAIASPFVIHSCSRKPDPARVVREIERNHPELQTALLAATESHPTAGDYLHHRLELALSHEAEQGHWNDTASPRQLAILSSSQWVAAALAASLFLTFLGLGLRRITFPPNSTSADAFGFTIEPGTIEIERGTPVTILARFAADPPDSVTLEVGTIDLTTTPLNRNLDDPVFATTLPGVDADLTYRVTTASGLVSPAYTITVYEFPRITRLDASLQPPGNPETHPPTVIENTRAITAPEGTSLTLAITTNQPIATATLTPKKGDSLPIAIDPADPTQLTASFPLTDTTRYTIALTDPAGRANPSPEHFDVKVVTNRPPEFLTKLPRRDARATPIEEITFEIDVKHRTPLAARGLTITIANQPPETIPFGPAQSSKEPTPIRHLLRLEPLGLQPNDLITWFSWADDTGPDGQTRRTEGELQFLSVRHFEETFRRVEASGEPGENLCIKLIKTQKEIVTSTWNVNRTPTQHRITTDTPTIRDSQRIAIDIADQLNTILTDPRDLVILRDARTDMTTALAALNSLIEQTDSAFISPALAAATNALTKLLNLSGKDWLMVVSNQSAPGASTGSRQFDIDVAPIDDRYEANRAAAAEADPAGAAARQILSRLRELAERQKDLNAKINELIIALQKPEETERQQLEREPAKLREEQLENLAELDRLTQTQPEPNQPSESENPESKLENVRQDLNAAADALSKAQPGEALANGRRAEEKLDDLRRDLEAKAANAFADELRDLREASSDLAKEQTAISEAITKSATAPPEPAPNERVNPSLADTAVDPTDLPARLARQREQLAQTTAAIEALAQEAAPTEPLLADDLTDALRDTARRGTEQALERSTQFTRSGSPAFAKTASDQAAEALEELEANIETAAAKILGGEEQALRFAQAELDQLRQAITPPTSNATPESGDFRSPESDSPGENEPPTPPDSPGQSPGESPGQSPSASPAQSPGPGQQGPGASPATSPAETGSSAQSPAQGSPLTAAGETYSDWSDRLRNLEELTNIPEVRDAVTRAREAARSIRRETGKRSADPRWDLVETGILAPLAEAQDLVREELARLTQDDLLVPIERDPVPDQYRDSVQNYYEQLAK